jgi:MotA/TolQ/ExbB proton channel family
MVQHMDMITLEKPGVHIVHMLVFSLVVGIIGAILFPGLRGAFMANPGLNGLILVTLLLGMLYAYRMVWRLFPEVNWVNNFRLGEPSSQAMPILLAPMATILGDATRRTVLSPQTMRSLLDSLASRFDESRDLLRYLIGLLIFLGLLGTFWGLLDTVSSIGDAVRSLDVTSQSAGALEALKSGLAGPLDGMAISFSSSLFGLGGSLILGFMDLKASQAQNRFYHNLEDWLSTITDIRAGDGSGSSVPALIKVDVQNLQKSVDRINTQMDQSRTQPSMRGSGASADTIEELADAVANLVSQMREEQKMVRQWIQTQQVQQNELQRLVLRSPSRSSTRE